ncbi:hypothetical protein ACOCJ7_01355 [Knoellia sp. CPCC 206453]|uniref:hypothetical protein n=1 Tax=Knoellia pratensis TaxID=3404796 RepID=UPI0036238625
MTLTPPSAGDPYRVPSAPPAYAVPSPPAAAADSPWSGPPQAPPTAGRAHPSWVAWTALALSALTFLITMSIGIIYAVERLGGSGSSEDFFYDAGMPSWGSVDLAPSGAATELALTNSVTEALVDGLEDGIPVEEVFCEPLPAPKKDTVATCSALVDELDSTVVLFFLDDDGGYLATLY